MTQRHGRKRKHLHKWAALDRPVEHVTFRSFGAWWESVKRAGWRVFFRHPHHYLVAFGLSLTVYTLGHSRLLDHVPVWLYALLENVSTLEET